MVSSWIYVKCLTSDHRIRKSNKLQIYIDIQLTRPRKNVPSTATLLTASAAFISLVYAPFILLGQSEWQIWNGYKPGLAEAFNFSKVVVEEQTRKLAKPKLIFNKSGKVTFSPYSTVWIPRYDSVSDSGSLI